MQKGKVYIASMARGKPYVNIPKNTIIVNVTSAQRLDSLNRRDFSPMTPIQGGYKGFWNFEAFWQSGKVFEDVDESETKEFWHNVTKATRRYPDSKNKTVLYCRFEHLPNERLDYVSARKKVYVPCYYDLMKNTEMALYWKEQRDKGTNIVILDYDGPKDDDGGLTCVELTKRVLHEKINDTRYPFGHGYVVGAFIKGIEPDEYIN